MSLERVLHPGARKLLVSPEEAAGIIQDGMNVGCSGFARAGYPKAVPVALAEQVAAGRKVRINLWTGASVGEELDGALSSQGAIHKRLPYQSIKSIRKHINSGAIEFVDQHLSRTPEMVRYGQLGELDVAIIEALAIDEQGNIILTTSVGNSPTYVMKAKKLIVEINNAQPEELMDIHDIYVPEDPPYRKPIPITHTSQRIGTPYIPASWGEITCIVESNVPDNPYNIMPGDEDTKKMAGLFNDFLSSEVKAGRLPAKLLPIQSGVGTIANAVLYGLVDSNFDQIEIYSEVLQDSVFDLIDAGKLEGACGTVITLSEAGQKTFRKNIKTYRDKVVLRSQELTNHPEIIRRLGLITMNTAVEADIYGHVNSSHVLGSQMINGIGGSGDFARNGYLNIFLTPSTAKGGNISSIVPMVAHVDHTEHDVMVIITEQGIADLRGLSARERAKAIIENCSHPDFRPHLMDYFREAVKKTGGNMPHLLDESLKWHVRLRDTGSMKVK